LTLIALLYLAGKGEEPRKEAQKLKDKTCHDADIAKQVGNHQKINRGCKFCTVSFASSLSEAATTAARERDTSSPY